jgi:hypothetical protein
MPVGYCLVFRGRNFPKSCEDFRQSRWTPRPTECLVEPIRCAELGGQWLKSTSVRMTLIISVTIYLWEIAADVTVFQIAAPAKQASPQARQLPSPKVGLRGTVHVAFKIS